MAERLTAIVGANIREFQRKMREVDRRVRQTATGVTKPIGARITEFQRKMKQVTTITKAAMRRDEKRIGADISEFMRKAALVMAATKALNKRVFVKIDTNVKEFQRVLGKIATTIRSIDTVLLSGLGGTLMANIPTLVPIISGLTGAIAMLGNMIGVLSGATFAYASALFFAGTAAVGFAAVAIPSIAGVFGEIENMSAAQRESRAEFEKFSNVYKGIVKELEKPVLEAFNKSMQIGTRILEMARPTFEAATVAVNNLLDSFNKSLDSAPVKAFFDYMNKSAGPLLEQVFKGIGYMLQGLLNMFVAFGPLAESTAKGFTDMNKRFAEWAANLGDNPGFQKFVAYVEENMPKVRAIFRDMISGIIRLFAAFAPHSQNMIDGFADMMARFKAWATTIGSNQQFQAFLDYITRTGPGVLDLIGNLTKFLVNIGIGMAPLGALLLNMMNGFLAWSNSMMKAHPLIGQIFAALVTLIGTLVAIVPSLVALKYLFGGLGTAIVNGVVKAVQFVIGLFTNFGTAISNLVNRFSFVSRGLSLLRVAFTLVTGPVGLIIAAITALIAVFMRMWQENENLRNGVTTAWNWIKETVMNVVQMVSDFVLSVWGSMVAWWQENNELILSAAQRVWDFIYFVVSEAIYAVWNVLQTVFNAMLPYLTMVWNNFVIIISAAWEIVKTVVTTAINAVMSIIRIVMLAINGDWQGVWNEIKNFMSIVWNGIVSVVTTLITAAAQIISNMWTYVKDLTVQLWDAIKTAISTAWEWIKQTTMDALVAVIMWIAQKWNEAKTTTIVLVTAMYNAVLSWFANIVATVLSKMIEAKNWVQNKWEEAKTAAATKLAELVASVISFFSDVVSTVSEKMEEAKQWVSDKVGEMPGVVKGFVGDMVSAGADLINGLIDGAVSMASDAIASIKTIAGDMVDAALSFFKIKSPSRVFREMGQYVAQGLSVGVDRKARDAVRSVTSVASEMTRAFSPNLALADMQASATLDTSVNNRDLGKVKHSFGAEMDNMELPEPVIIVRNDWDGEKVRTTINNRNAKDQRMRRGFGGK